ncbi:hypothetical protein D9757_007863 [Collybiopsis confluens]|uniref:Uncharacterized protein n=1 Tax=Collybiopsis confluens TaxID=2823264 RepID=A0A8H5M594_9AGAR|nr:hypothetical protein D9757_007863 [Collybiopsis confluens]
MSNFILRTPSRANTRPLFVPLGQPISQIIIDTSIQGHPSASCFDTRIIFEVICCRVQASSSAQLCMRKFEFFTQPLHMADFSPDETPSELFDENMWLQGAMITSVGYGAVLTLYILAFYILVSRLDQWNRRSHVALLAYITAQFILATLFQAANARFTQLAFINDRNFPGGPSGFEVNMFFIPIDMMGNASYIIANWLADGLLILVVALCRHLWQLPISEMDDNGLPLSYYAWLLSGIMYLIQVSTASPFLSSAANFTIIDSSVSLGLNLILTIMIVGRLLIYRHRVSRNFGKSVSQDTYTGIISMLVESAALYAAFSLFFIIPFALNSSIENIAFQALSMVQGKAWSSSTARQLTLVKESGAPPSSYRPSHIQFNSRDNTSTVQASITDISTKKITGTLTASDEAHEMV